MIRLYITAQDAEELRNTLQDLANLPDDAVLTYAGREDAEAKPKPPKKTKLKAEKNPEPPPATEEPAPSGNSSGEAPPPANTISTDDVRERLQAAVSKIGADKVQEIATQFAPTLAEMDAADYPELLRQIAEID